MAAGPEQPAALGERVAGALEVLENLGEQDRVRAAVGQRDRVGVADMSTLWSPCSVCSWSMPTCSRTCGANASRHGFVPQPMSSSRPDA